MVTYPTIVTYPIYSITIVINHFFSRLLGLILVSLESQRLVLTIKSATMAMEIMVPSTAKIRM